jgi:uncharacterized repeat protein (TIGR01451 family)
MADLIISKDSAPDPVVAGELLTYTIQVSNAGPSDATGVIVTDTLPAEVSFVSASSGCIANTPIRCELGTLNAHASTIITVVVSVDVGIVGTINSAATTIGNQTDPVTSNNDTDELTTVLEKIYYINLPLIINGSIVDEPNDSCDQAHTINPNFNYSFLPDDPVDWYQFDLPSSGLLAVAVTNFKPRSGQVAVFEGDSCSSRRLVGSDGNFGETKTVDAKRQPAGHYYIFVSNDGTLNDQDPYSLLVNFTP